VLLGALSFTESFGVLLKHYLTSDLALDIHLKFYANFIYFGFISAAKNVNYNIYTKYIIFQRKEKNKVALLN